MTMTNLKLFIVGAVKPSTIIDTSTNDDQQRTTEETNDTETNNLANFLLLIYLDNCINLLNANLFI